jgi:serine/threonine-protein kinase
LSSDLEFLITDGPERGRAIRFPSAQFMVGSGEGVGARLTAAQQVEPRHAEVEVDPMGVVWVRDLTGRRLLWLNGEQLERGALEPGGALRVGDVELLLRLAEPEGARRSSALISGRDDGPATALTSLHAGTVIDGRYEVIDKLAVGGMGEVYRARHVELGKLMVLKVMRARLSDDPHIVARFKREAIAASRIGQQNIVDVSDFGRTADGRFFFVMEYLDGVTLKRLIAQEGAQPLQRVLHLTVQIANALVAAHAQGIVHRDLKPENIMLLQRPGQPDFIKVLDFGVAKVTPAPGEAGHTSFGLVLGTPQYMSPEQARAVVVDARSDVYSLGLMLYELLAGRPTFVAETPSLLMVMHISAAPPRFSAELVSRLPSEVERLVFRMLAKDPAARPRSMHEVATTLEALRARHQHSEFALSRIASGVTEAVRVVGAPLQPEVDLNATTLMAAPRPTPPPAVADHLGFAPPAAARAPKLAIGVVVALGAAAGVVLAWPSRAPVTAPVTAPVAVVSERVPPAPVVVPPAKFTLTLTSPIRASVFHGEVQLGSTPLALTREAGTVLTLVFRAAGFKPLSRTVSFEADQPLAVELEKEKAAAPVVKKPPALELKDVPF